METMTGNKRLVWEDKKARYISAGDIVGSFTKWAVQQSPYVCPENLEEGIKQFSKAVGYKGKYKSLKMKGSTLHKLVKKAIDKCPQVLAWNDSKIKVAGRQFNFVDRYYTTKPDYDFVDLSALARNIYHDVWLDTMYSDYGLWEDN